MANEIAEKPGEIYVKPRFGFYAKYIKRPLDICCALAAVIVFSPLYVILTVVGAIAMRGNPFFTQLRPGKIDPKTGKEKIFKLIKFRTMSNKKDQNGNLLPDSERLNRYGRFLRASSLDELPEAFNILKGDMSVIGPRPQLVRDMVFMTGEQRKRHLVRPGLSGLAQTRGRNALAWDRKLTTDLEYIQSIAFWGDVKIVVNTVKQVFFKEKGIENSTVDEVDLTDDFGDYLLKDGRINQDEYQKKQKEAKELLGV